ncbi:hypothetical protein J3A83DRAFT_4084090 [Scleroderma citrinum]
MSDIDFIFPAMGANGIVQPSKQLSQDSVQKWISEATTGSSIQGSFLTYCFHQGGAQHWFMHAPTGQQWMLGKV